MKIFELKKGNIGAWVKFIDGAGKNDYGRLKSFDNEIRLAWIVFHCAGQWHKYYNYTAQGVKYGDFSFVEGKLKQQFDQEAERMELEEKNEH